MTKRTLPKLPALSHSNLSCEVPDSVLGRWNSNLRAQAGDNVISIYGFIGGWDGATASEVASALERIGAEQVVVNVNSPGGDYFEGVAIYNLLRAHSRKVTVRVIGVAASAASVVAMAGDEVQIAKAGSLMIHNTMMVAFGNRKVMREAADILEKFDGAMAGLYADRTGLERAEIAAMLDAETWLTGEEAVEEGFADALLPADQVKEEKKGAASNAAIRRVEAALSKSGMPRSERRALLRHLTGTPSAAEDAKPGAGVEAKAEIDRITAGFEAYAATLNQENKQ